MLDRKVVKKYLNEKQIDREQLLNNLETHFINDECYYHLMDDNFKGFIEERARLIESEMQRRIY